MIGFCLLEDVTTHQIGQDETEPVTFPILETGVEVSFGSALIERSSESSENSSWNVDFNSCLQNGDSAVFLENEKYVLICLFRVAVLSNCYGSATTADTTGVAWNSREFTPCRQSTESSGIIH